MTPRGVNKRDAFSNYKALVDCRHVPRVRSVELHRYQLLPPPARTAMHAWVGEAEKVRGRARNVETFIFAWFGFNAWANVVVDGAESDRELVAALAYDKHLGGFFANLRSEDPVLNRAAVGFGACIPIFQQERLRRSNIYSPHDISKRRKWISEQLAKGVKCFEPHCYPAHESTPLDWMHIVGAIYRVRCNLFHGDKGVSDESDLVIVESAGRLLVSLTGHLLGLGSR